MNIETIKQEIMQLDSKMRTNLLQELQEKFQEESTFKPSLKDIQYENELLILQLHQVQEELELYYLANQQMREVLQKSCNTMEQARKILFHSSNIKV